VPPWCATPTPLHIRNEPYSISTFNHSGTQVSDGSTAAPQLMAGMGRKLPLASGRNRWKTGIKNLTVAQVTSDKFGTVDFRPEQSDTMPPQPSRCQLPADACAKVRAASSDGAREQASPHLHHLRRRKSSPTEQASARRTPIGYKRQPRWRWRGAGPGEAGQLDSLLADETERFVLILPEPQTAAGHRP